MDTRKLIKFGRNSYVISLPKPWLAKNNLKKGDLLGVEPHDTTLEIIPRPSPSQRMMLKQIIKEDDRDLAMIRMEIISAYLANANLIEIEGDPHLRHSLAYKEIILNLTGFEIVEITKDRILAKDILDERAVSITSSINRIHRIAQNQLEECMQAANQQEVDAFVERDKDINRLVYLLFRVLRYLLANPTEMRERSTSSKDLKRRSITSWDINRDWAMTMRLEYLGDYAKRMARYMFKQKEKPVHCRSLIKTHGEMLKCLETTMDAFYQDKPHICYGVEMTLSKIAESLEHLMVKAKDRNFILAVATAREAIRSIRHMGRAMLNVQVLQTIDVERSQDTLI